MLQKSGLAPGTRSVPPKLAFALSVPGKVFRKYFWWADVTNRPELKVPVFVLGMHRSGTTMIFNVLASCPECQVHWGHQKQAFRNSRIRSGETIRRLIRKAYKRVVVFKAHNDIQRTPELLGLHKNARAVWVYRNFDDVVNSAVQRWNTAHRDIVRGIALGVALNPGHDAMREGMDADDVETLKQMCRQEISPEEGAALLWYFRNLLYFKLKLQHDPRTLLVKYEDLVIDPRYHFRRILEHCSCEFGPERIDGIFSSSVGKTKAPILRADIRALCEGMLGRLNEQYSQLHEPYSIRTA
jgi:hypothetical protein